MNVLSPLPPWIMNLRHESDVVKSASWLTEFRAQQWEQFLQTGWPTQKNERFKYNDLSLLRDKHFSSATKIKPSHLGNLINRYRLAESILFVFVNGFFLPEFSDTDKLPQEVIALNLLKACKRNPELIKSVWPMRSAFTNHPFASLNAATFNDGLFLYLPKACKLSTLHFLYLATGTETFVAQPHHIIVQEDDSELSLIEDYHGETNVSYMMNVVTHIQLHRNAKLEHVKIQSENAQAIHLAHTFVQQKENSQATLTHCASGGAFARDDLVLSLQEPGANCITSGIYRLNNPNQYLDHHIDICHEAERTKSEMLYKGILAAKSRAVFNGRLYVDSYAQKINAYQANHNLLLAKDAEVYSKPELEIYADDVKCKHGASTGQIDEQAIFYLGSRGIPRADAINMLLKAFADEIIERIKEPHIKMHVLRGFNV